MLVFRLPVPDFARWRREAPETSPIRIDTDGARALLLAVEPCPPYLSSREGVALSAYYVASNGLYRALRATGSPASVPVKPLIAGFCVGAYGRSGVTAVPGVGTRFAAQVLKSDADPDGDWEWREDRGLSPECADCALCVSACPTGALDGTGRVDTSKCLRAQASAQAALPEASRALIGASLWGCDICQDVCPRNAGAAAVPMPDALERAISLSRLLRGDVAELGEWIGTNYARPARMQARACILAANLSRRDLADEIAPLARSEVEAVRACARWALDKLRVEG